MSKFLLIFILIDFCLSDVPKYNCNTIFQRKLQAICSKINNGCQYFSSKKLCTKTGVCSDYQEDKCEDIIPDDDHHKCIWEDDRCKEVNRSCYDTFKSPSKEYCESLNSSDSKNCFYLKDENENTCTEYYQNCEDYKGNDAAICESIKHLNSNQTGFVKTQTCVYNQQKEECQTKYIYCEEYILGIGEDYNICYLLNVKDASSNKRCVYDFENKACKEDYKTCEDYESLGSTENARISCENIILADKDKICGLDENNQCVTKNRTCEDYKSYESLTFCLDLNYNLPFNKTCKFNGLKCYEDYIDCQYYTGNDKKTCQSITPYIPGAKCILEGDSQCVSYYLTCSQATTEIECYGLAAPEGNDKTKMCIFINGVCIENYKTCESYIGFQKIGCESILQFNGKKCQFESGMCKSFDKVCSEGLIGTECQLITRVSEPTKKVCQFDENSGSCFENYKYCSDYEGNDTAICANIKPYSQPNGEGIIYPMLTHKCVFEDEKIGCEKKLLNCSEAKGNKDLCESISYFLKDQSENKKYCLYFNDNCTEQYITCGDYDKDVKKEICEAIIPKNSETIHCSFNALSRTCEEKEKKCEEFDVKDYEYQCLEISPFCSYSDGICSQIEKNCSDITFFIANSTNEYYCNVIKLSDESKVCALSADQLKCEIRDIPSSAESSENSGSSAIGSSATSADSSQNQDKTESSSSCFLQSNVNKLIFIILSLLI